MSFQTGFTFTERAVAPYALHGPMFLFVDCLGFSLSFFFLWSTPAPIAFRRVAHCMLVIHFLEPYPWTSRDSIHHQHSVAFRCHSWSIPKLTLGAGEKWLYIATSKKDTFSRHQPTQIQEVCQRHLSSPNASNQNNQSTQTGVKKFSSPKRTPTRHSEAKDFSVWRQTWFIMVPKTRSKKLVERWRPERDLDSTVQETNWDAQ